MGRLIVITSGKGGAGKSTFAVLLANGLTGFGKDENHKKVLLIEQDDGLRCLDLMLGVENRVIYDRDDVATGVCTPSDALVPCKYNPSVFLLPASLSYKRDSEGRKTAAICDGFLNYFDYVILDAPAGLGNRVGKLVKHPTETIIIVTPDLVCARDAATVSLLLDEENIKSKRLVINRVPTKEEKGCSTPDLDEIIDTVGVQLLGVIPEDRAMAEGVVKGEIKANTPAITAVNNIASRIEGNDVRLYII